MWSEPEVNLKAACIIQQTAAECPQTMTWQQPGCWLFDNAVR